MGTMVFDDKTIEIEPEYNLRTLFVSQVIAVMSISKASSPLAITNVAATTIIPTHANLCPPQVRPYSPPLIETRKCIFLRMALDARSRPTFDLTSQSLLDSSDQIREQKRNKKLVD